MKKRTFDEMISYFNRTVSKMDIDTKYKMELLGMITAILQEYEETKPKWIPCSERLPEEDMWTGSGKQYSADVLITVVNTIEEETVIDYGHTMDGEWYSDTTDCFIPHGWKPVAWMPLPEPWKGEQE